jgi:hypothetical protein
MKTKLSEYVKVAGAAEILGLSQGTVRARAEAGKIPMHKNLANDYRLFLRAELDSFLDQCAQPVPQSIEPKVYLNPSQKRAK